MSFLSHVPTVGVHFRELEHMAGTTALGFLAIRNNITTFMHLLSLYENPRRALNVEDIYGNTPLHYFALRGNSAGATIAYLEEMGADRGYRNHANDTPSSVLASRKLSCRERDQSVGAFFCSARLLVSVEFFT